ncbi:hypothetical protein ABIF26_006455 [Bradyrhizobium elkanii]|uniref:hypothetical protein n=1 Tax=Bradyrhizobium elkanii TaxID=29448 RepID=UPI00351478E1
MHSPDEAEAHGRSAIRQLEVLGCDTAHIDPLKMRADAERHVADMAAPATKQDIADLMTELASLKLMLVMLADRPQIINNSSDMSRIVLQASRRLQAASR